MQLIVFPASERFSSFTSVRGRDAQHRRPCSFFEFAKVDADFHFTYFIQKNFNLFIIGIALLTCEMLIFSKKCAKSMTARKKIKVNLKFIARHKSNTVTKHPLIINCKIIYGQYNKMLSRIDLPVYNRHRIDLLSFDVY